MQPINVISSSVLASAPGTHVVVGIRTGRTAPESDSLDSAPALQVPESIASDRPVIEPPGFSQIVTTETREPTLSELRFLSAMAVFGEFADDVLKTLGVRLDAFRMHLQTITSENMEKLKEAAENAKSADFWSLLKKVANSLLSALSIVVGVSLIATGAGSLVGGAMIASGIFSIANMLMSEAETWDWLAKKLSNEDENRRKMLAMFLPIGFGVVTCGIGLFGAAGAFAWSGINMIDKSILVAQAALAIFDGGTTIGKGYADAKLIWTQADLTKTKALTTIERQKIENATKSVETVLDGLNMAHEKSAQFVQLAVRANQAVVKDLSS